MLSWRTIKWSIKINLNANAKAELSLQLAKVERKSESERDRKELCENPGRQCEKGLGKIMKGCVGETGEMLGKRKG